jgi:hypothetical protein
MVAVLLVAVVLVVARQMVVEMQYRVVEMQNQMVVEMQYRVVEM